MRNDKPCYLHSGLHYKENERNYYIEGLGECRMGLDRERDAHNVVMWFLRSAEL